MNRRLVTSTAYKRAARRLIKRQLLSRDDLLEVLSRLSSDAFDPSLKTHKLHGKFDGMWACSLGYDLRLMFEIVEEGEESAIVLLSIGTHDEVY